jgi:hypothetical protein
MIAQPSADHSEKSLWGLIGLERLTTPSNLVIFRRPGRCDLFGDTGEILMRELD